MIGFSLMVGRLRRSTCEDGAARGLAALALDVPTVEGHGAGGVMAQIGAGGDGFRRWRRHAGQSLSLWTFLAGPLDGFSMVGDGASGAFLLIDASIESLLWRVPRRRFTDG